MTQRWQDQVVEPRPTCRGSIQLGTGCRSCEKCKQEQLRIDSALKSTAPLATATSQDLSKRAFADVVMKELTDLVNGVDSSTGKDLTLEDVKLLAGSVKLNFLRFLRSER